ncbi:velvet factor [Globomyces pollinis-pini]|nr:velvet factor [Globomyces pollinis-pini]
MNTKCQKHFTSMKNSFLEMNWSGIVLQQPRVGRMCGIKQMVNRRAIDPPLIIQLNTPHIQISPQSGSNYTCHLTLLDEDHSHRDHFLHPDGHVVENLLGSSTMSAMPFPNPHNNTLQLYFVFESLSIRVTGNYIISCHIVEHDSGTVQTILTSCFTVYNNKNFPGSLSKTLSF